MTTAEMLTILGDRMEDPSGDLFTTAVKERYLNRAQDKLVQMLKPDLLTDLHVLKTGISMSYQPRQEPWTRSHLAGHWES